MFTAKFDFIPQNMSLYDRVFRFVLGVLLLGVPYAMIATGDAGAVSHPLAWAMLLSFYPFMTAIVGCDPFYALFHKKTCGVSETNQCGSVPYQIDAALGHHPIPDNDFEHELSHSRHEKMRPAKTAA